MLRPDLVTYSTAQCQELGPRSLSSCRWRPTRKTSTPCRKILLKHPVVQALITSLRSQGPPAANATSTFGNSVRPSYNSQWPTLRSMVPRTLPLKILTKPIGRVRTKILSYFSRKRLQRNSNSMLTLLMSSSWPILVRIKNRFSQRTKLR